MLGRLASFRLGHLDAGNLEVLEAMAVLPDEFCLEGVAIDLRYREDDVDRKQLMKRFARMVTP